MTRISIFVLRDLPTRIFRFSFSVWDIQTNLIFPSLCYKLEPTRNSVTLRLISSARIYISIWFFQNFIILLFKQLRHFNFRVWIEEAIIFLRLKRCVILRAHSAFNYCLLITWHKNLWVIGVFLKLIFVFFLFNISKNHW